VPPIAADYAETVRRHAYRVTDLQVAALLEAGLSEDEVFEVTVAAAAGAGLERLDAGLRAMG
jgi:alkylhydroperoxidase family enzyme